MTTFAYILLFAALAIEPVLVTAGVATIAMVSMYP